MMKKLLLIALLFFFAGLNIFSQSPCELTFDTEWTGNTDSDWFNPTNWTNDVPEANSNVSIGQGTNSNPAISGDTPAAANNVCLKNNTTLNVTGTLNIGNGLETETNDGEAVTINVQNIATVNGQIDIDSRSTLTVTGALTGSGQLGAFGTININGSSANFERGEAFIVDGDMTVDGGSVQFDGLSVQQGGTLTIQNNGGVTINPSNVDIASGSSITVNQGTLDVTIGDLTVGASSSLTINNGGVVNHGVVPAK